MKRCGGKRDSAIIEMCKNSRTAVRVKGKRLELFNVNVGVHQGLILIYFLFAFVLDDIIKDVRGGLLKEILDADDMVLFKDSWEEMGKRYLR